MKNEKEIDIIKLKQKHKKQVEKLNNIIKTLEEILEKRYIQIDKLEKERKDFFEVEQNLSAYANFKQFEDLIGERKEYKELYEHEIQKNRNINIRNKRNAGRKPKIYEHLETVTKLINEHKNISTRQIAKIIGISHNSVAKLLKIIKNK